MVTPSRTLHPSSKIVPEGLLNANLFLAFWGLAFSLAATAVGALVWAIRRGEFDDFKQGAASIFDADEPAGRPTDRFPGH